MNYLKSACRHCSGHIEYPAEAGGQEASCPHCGQMTGLPAAGRSSNIRQLVFAGVAIVGAVGLLLLILRVLPSTKVASNPAASTNLPPPVVVIPVLITNQFSVSPFNMEKSSGSSLVHVVGFAKNLDSRQRFGVRVEFSLWDANSNRLGTASDYIATMAAGSDWKFKAMVMESKAVAANLESIQETK